MKQRRQEWAGVEVISYHSFAIAAGAVGVVGTVRTVRRERMLMNRQAARVKARVLARAR